jgi:hypothetical protein
MADLRCLSYGDPLDTQGGYLRMPMSTAFESGGRGGVWTNLFKSINEEDRTYTKRVLPR